MSNLEIKTRFDIFYIFKKVIQKISKLLKEVIIIADG